MTALLAPGRTPQNDAELARSFHDRLRKLETASTVRVGPWVLSNDPATGNLRATRPGQTVIIDESGSTEVLDAASLNLSGYVTDKELVDALSQIDTGGSLESMWSDLYTALTGILNPVNALQALAKFFKIELGGAISADRLPLIPLSHIRPSAENLILDGGFDDEATLLGFPDWDYDDVDGRDKPGCVYTMADGTSHILYSNDIEVAADDTLDVSVGVKWEGLTAAAGTNPIRLNLTAYDATGAMVGGAPVMLAAVASPTGNSGGTDGWETVLHGTYDVPAGVKYVNIEPTVTPDATAGGVKFDDADAHKTGLFLQGYVKDLVSDLQSLLNWIEATLDAALGGLGLPAIGSIVDKLLDFQDGLESLDDMAGDAWNAAQNALSGLAEKLGIDDWNTWLSGQWDNLKDALLNAPETVLGVLGMGQVSGLPDLNSLTEQIRDIMAGLPITPTLPVLQDIKDWRSLLGLKTQGLNSSGQLDGAKIVGTVAKGAVEGLVDLGTQVTDGIAGIWNGWFGSGGTGDPAEVQQTIEAIKNAVINGYTVDAYTSDTANVPKPDCTEMIAILVGSGQPGVLPVGKTGQPGGLDGSYLAIQLDVPSLPSAFDIDIGTAGAKTYLRAAAGTPHTGAVLAESPAPGSPGGITTAFGFTSTSSQPGRGGKGGNGQDAINTPNTPSTKGEAGTSSPLAAGGPGGTTTSGVGNNGGPGGNVSTGSSTKCGGGGGGGGGGGSGATFGVGRAGGNGGAGGFPGGGGGSPGAGSRGSTSNGASGAIGPGGPGCLWLFYR